MPQQVRATQKLIESFTRNQIRQAGARYTPGIDPNAPNLANEHLVDALAHVACGADFTKHAQDVAAKLAKEWRAARGALSAAEPCEAAILVLQSLLASAARRFLAGDQLARVEILDALTTLRDLIEAEQGSLRQAGEQSPEAESKLQDRRRRVGQFAHEVSELISQFDGVLGRLLENRLCLLSGQWGTGKTHSLCDYATGHLRRRKPVLLLLAKNFQGRERTLEAVVRAIGYSGSIENLLDELNELGARASERILLIVDGVNEGVRQPWRKAIERLAKLIEGRGNLALVVSCRAPFESVSMPAGVLDAMVKLKHVGFEDREFDAQSEFFRYYRIPLPEVPLLDEEFSRPLTLKLICESFRNLSTKKKKEGFQGVASGQKGMTYVLELFVNEVGARLEKKYALPPKACWVLLKGNRKISDPKTSGFAPLMAETMTEYVSKRAALRIVRAHFPRLQPRQHASLLDDLRTSGLLDEDYVYRSVGGKVVGSNVIRLPYQRFSDHLVARHLLENYLDKSNEASLTSSFSPRKPLGRVFKPAKYMHRQFAMPGWAEAVIVEFPEAVKRATCQERELYFFLPERSKRIGYYVEPFLNGLFWRAPTSFSEGTRSVLNALLNSKNDFHWHSAMDSLVALSTRPGHPYSAQRLYQYLSQFPMADRDIKWSECIRNHHRSPSIRRLLKWVEKADEIRVGRDSAHELIVLLSLILTTVDRDDRDLATRALVELGERFPALLFKHALVALEFNDPYVPERVLAASYGVVLSRAAFAGTAFKRLHAQLARALCDRMFVEHAPNATNHALMRDYAIGIIQAAIATSKANLLSTHQLSAISPPFQFISSPFPDPSDISDEERKDGNSAIHTDFGNYTLGRLIPNRHNYDFKNLDYVAVRHQIEWRIGNLGYRNHRFKELEAEIGRDKFYASRANGSRLDRYGKKYSWIAFYEMYGWRESQGKLDENRQLERTSDASIDPTFPKAPPKWKLPLPQIFSTDELSKVEWMARGPSPDFKSLLRVEKINGNNGPWVLLQGFVEREDVKRGREFFVFLRGVLLRKRDLTKLRQKFLEIQYPGNDAIPDGPSSYYAFAGEAGASHRFASELLKEDGTYARDTRDAFGSTVFVPSKAKRPRKTRIVRFVDPASTEGGGTSRFEFSFEPNRGRWRHVPGVRIEVPFRRFSWESHHSGMNDFSGFSVPAASIIQTLQLRTKGRSVDFRDKSGRVATIYRTGEKSWKQSHNVLYIREDCLVDYLRKTRQVLAWCNWGERDLARGEEIDRVGDDQRAVFEAYAHIHRRFYAYDGRNGAVIESTNDLLCK